MRDARSRERERERERERGCKKVMTPCCMYYRIVNNTNTCKLQNKNVSLRRLSICKRHILDKIRKTFER